MPTVQWVDIPFGLETPAGNLGFNAFLATTNPSTGLASQIGTQWILDIDKCAAGAAKRVTRDNIPQKDGEIMHRYFRGGLVMQLGALACEVTVATPGNNVFQPACGEDLVDLYDDLQRCLNSISNSDGRLKWIPTAKPTRMQDRARWIGGDAGGGGFEAVQVAIEDNVFTSVQFALLCPFPYGMDFTEIATALGGPAVVVNGGTCPFYPVIRVQGPASTFQLKVTNALTGQSLELDYDDSLPGANTIAGGTYVEFDFFRETAYLGIGAGPADGASYKAGIDVFVSDFWGLTPGNNTVELSGTAASASMLWQDAWSG